MGEIKDYINVLGYKSSTLLKSHALAGFPCEEKSMSLNKMKVRKCKKTKRWPVYILQSLAVTKLDK
jgi:hypothetical protein